jgi:DNA topoisomerase-1
MAAKSSTAEPLPNPFLLAAAEEAKDAGLRYSTDAEPGIRRKTRAKGFVYFRANGDPVREGGVLGRIKRLAIPPAWTDVWISPHDNGHIQATGRDARGRKQYRYHVDWRQQRDESKFGRMLAFARALPRIRRRVKRDLSRRGMPREKALATVVRLLEVTLIRVGNDEYARDNHSFGLTTMRNRHARVAGEKIRFAFSGKSGKRHEISLHDPQLARVVRRCQDLPGQRLFGYEDDEGETRDVHSQDVNDYIRAITGQDFTAKDFRTWAGTVLAATALQKLEAFVNQSHAKKNVVTAIEAVARLLGNTPAVCRRSYVHPGVLESYLAGDTMVTVRDAGSKMARSLSRLRSEEAAVVMLLQRRLKQQHGRLNGSKSPVTRRRNHHASKARS